MLQPWIDDGEHAVRVTAVEPRETLPAICTLHLALCTRGLPTVRVGLESTSQNVIIKHVPKPNKARVLHGTRNALREQGFDVLEDY